MSITSISWSQAPDDTAKTDEHIDTQAPNLDALESTWWQYFNAPAAQLSSRSKTFTDSLKKVASTLSPEGQQKAEAVIAKIEDNLNTYEQGLQRVEPTQHPPTPIKKSYTIEELMTLDRDVSQLKIDLNSQIGEKLDKEKQVESAEELLRNTKLEYANAEKRSERKALLALEIIATRSNLEVLKQTQAIYEKTIKIKRKEINQLEEELNAALGRLGSNDLDIIIFSKEAQENAEKVTDEEKQLKATEAREAAALSESGGKRSEEDYIELSLATDQAEVKLMMARSQHMLSKIKLYLAYLLTTPTSLDMKNVSDDIRDWELQLPSFQHKYAELKAQAERQLQRAGQLLTEEPPTDVKKPQSDALAQQRIVSLAQENLLLLQRLDNQLTETQFLLQVLKSKVSLVIGGGRLWLENLLNFFSGIYKQTTNWLYTELFYIGKNPVTLFGILEFIAIIIFTLWISGVILKTITKVVSQRKGVRKSLVYRFSRLFYYFMLTIGLLIALSALGFDFSNLLIVAGALGVGLGFGLQSIFNNFISGIILLFESQLKVGDFIELESGLRGEIREINVRSTLITDNDGIDVLIPNSEIISNKVLNWTLKVPYRRVHIPFSVAYGTDKDFMAGVVVEAAKKVPHTLIKLGIPDPVVRFTNLGPDGMEFELVVWVTEKYTKRSRATRSDYLWAIETALTKNNITIPFPQRDVHIMNQDK